VWLRRRRATGDLTGFEARVRSQNGEDGVIAEIVRRIGAPERTFVEFGVEDGSQGNCVRLAEAGWSGLFMEADAAMHERLAARYAARDDVGTLHAAVTADTIEALLDAGGVPAEPAVLSIDIDSNDFHVWAAIRSRRPRLVVIEYNASLPRERRLVMPRDDAFRWDGTDFFGASLGAFEALGEERGYALVHTESAGVNAFFVRRDLLAGTGLPTGDGVPRRAPNYFGTGQGHPRDPQDRRWLDLERDGALVGRDDR
jgi:hypothetical protein